MRPPYLIAVLALIFGTWIHSAAAIQVENGEMDGHSELAQKIFMAERRTIAEISKRQPLIETYLQSLDPEARSESVLDDAYFLGRLALSVDSSQPGRLQKVVFGASPQSRRVRVNTGDHWPVYPDGYVDMLFVDLGGFDEENYVLSYKGVDFAGSEMWLRIAVRPRNSRSSGRFLGEIWVQNTSFRITRIAGAFSPKNLEAISKYFNPGGISRLGLYLHFESWRQQVSPGVWLPSYTYFDEQRMWNEGRLTTSFRLRGHIWVWDYRHEQQGRDGAANVLSELENSGLLASCGPIELSLDQIIREILLANGLQESDIRSRVLLTTPVELFNVDRTVFISRGLLNLLPDKLTLAGLIAREIAKILLGQSQAPTITARVFDGNRSTDFAGFGFQYADIDRVTARDQARRLLAMTPYANSTDLVDTFLLKLARSSPQIPHLSKSHFGPVMFDAAAFRAKISARTVPGTSDEFALELRGEYGINSWQNGVVLIGKSPQPQPANSIAPGQSPSASPDPAATRD